MEIKVTSKGIANQYKRGTIPLAVVKHMYELRDTEVQVLSEKAEISVSDINELERTGRFKIANSLFHKCTIDARNVLLQDESHSVRSAAAISARYLSTIPSQVDLANK